MRWLGILAGVVLLAALIGGVGTMAYQAGLAANGVTQVIQAAPAGAEGGTVIVKGMHPGYGYGYGYGFGHPFGFLHFVFLILIVGLIFRLVAFGFRGGHRGPWAGRYGGWEDEARRRHDEWHAGTSSTAGQGHEPPSAGVGS
jgi:hypothetical protein